MCESLHFPTIGQIEKQMINVCSSCDNTDLGDYIEY